MARRFAFHEVRSLLEDLANTGPATVLVGGQAVGGWAARYAPRNDLLRDAQALASKDLDFCGDRGTVRALARSLGVEPLFPSLDHVVAGQVGVIFVRMPDGESLRIDVLANLRGVDGTDVMATGIPVEFGSLTRPGRLSIMHPALCMESRVHNVVSMPSRYDTPLGLLQLRASMVCAREYQREVLDGKLEAPDPVRTVLKVNERIARFALESPQAKTLLRTHGIDVAAAMFVDERLPDAFRTIRLPQLQARLAARERAP